MIWQNPEWFWALLIVPVILIKFGFDFWQKRVPVLSYSSSKMLKDVSGSWRTYGVFLPPILFIGGLILAVLALARPQLQNTVVERNAEGIDIVMALDLSTSMRAEDLKPNRFDAAKTVATEFIDKRTSDRIGLVAFAAKSFTVCPPTLDYDLLKKLLTDVQMGVIEDGTAIGMGLATSVNRLKESEAESKVIILLTDGQNNSGEIDPVTAADLAASFDIKVYTIGAGTRGTAPYPIDDPIFGRRYQNVRVDIDEEMMQRVADITGGKYYRATDTESLLNIYGEIDELERTKVEEVIYTENEDLYLDFLLPGIALLILGLMFERSVFRYQLV